MLVIDYTILIRYKSIIKQYGYIVDATFRSYIDDL